MKTILIVISLFMLSIMAMATETICEPGISAVGYSNMRVQIMGLIPLKNEFKNNYLTKISNVLIPFFKEQCKTNATSDDIVFNMLNKCVETAKNIVEDKKEVQAYKDNCQLGYALARAQLTGAKEVVAKCEKKDTVSDLSRNIDKVVEKKGKKDNTQDSKVIDK
ncbi:MAG: hypothetical protein H7336_07635 [Bacteriovorax sp.]|nr:hypothetical protein [Bacteriovorax sp.]